MIEGVPAFGVKGMPGSGDDHVFGVRYLLGHDFGVARWYQDILASRHDQGGDLDRG